MAADSDRFVVYFNDKVYARKLIRVIAIAWSVVGALCLVARLRHTSYPTPMILIFLAVPAVLLLLSFISHLAHNLDYTNFAGPGKPYMELDRNGIRMFGNTSFPWESISSIGFIDGVAARGRGGVISYLILNFQDDQPLQSLGHDALLQLTVDNSWAKFVARVKSVPLAENFVSIAIKGGGEVSANLTAPDTLIASMAKHYFSHARNKLPIHNAPEFDRHDMIGQSPH